MKMHLLDINYWTILLVILPALIVFMIVYLLMRTFFSNQLRLRMLEGREQNSTNTRHLKLQAYERLMLFCERVTIPNLLLRIQSSDMSARDLKSALIVAVQQEFEYNLSQQLYVSDKLWQIIKLAKNQLIEIITHVYGKVHAKATAEEFSRQLILFIESQKKDPIETAKMGIKREASLLL